MPSPMLSWIVYKLVHMFVALSASFSKVLNLFFRARRAGYSNETLLAIVSMHPLSMYLSTPLCVTIDVPADSLVFLER